MNRRFASFLILLVSVLTLAVATSSAEEKPVGALGVVRKGGSVSTADAAARRRNLRYHGGRILARSTTRPVFWEPPGYTFPLGYKDLIERYFTDIATDSGTTENVYRVGEQYFDRKPNGRVWHRVHYLVTAEASITLTDALPSTGCRLRTGYTACVTDKQVRAKINQLKTSIGLNSVYFMFLPEGIDTCFGRICASTYFCAYHSAFKTHRGWVIYANQPYGDVGGCDYNEKPNDNPADRTVNLVSHEHREAINDPLGNAWYDRNGLEGSDKCQLNFGDPLGNTATGDYNQLINGDPYHLQSEWSNKSRGCRLRGF